jgi:cytosine permease
VTIVLGAIGIVVGVIGAADYFVQFILVIGTIIAPYGGVYLASFFTGRKTARWAHGATVPLVDGWSIAAWVVGIFVAVATTNPADGPGFGWFTITSISALDGLLVGFVAYLALLPFRRRVQQDAAASVTDEVNA